MGNEREGGEGKTDNGRGRKVAGSVSNTYGGLETPMYETMHFCVTIRLHYKLGSSFPVD